MTDPTTRSGQLDRALTDLLTQAPEVEAAAVVSFDGLPMASVLPAAMDEDRVAAMSAALLSLGERAAEGLGRGSLSQVYIEGEHGTVFLVSADDEAVLVAVAAKGAKVGMMLFEVRRAATVVAAVLRAADVTEAARAAAAAMAFEEPTIVPPVAMAPVVAFPSLAAVEPFAPVEPVHPSQSVQPMPSSHQAEPTWPADSVIPSVNGGVEPPAWP